MRISSWSEVRSEERQRLWHSRSLWAVVTCALVVLPAPPARSQVRVNALTEVRVIRFSGAQSVSERSLRSVLQTKDRGPAYSLRVALGKIPFVPSPKPHQFS